MELCIVPWNISTVLSSNMFKLPATCTRTSFSWRLKAARSLAISAALAADFSISTSELRHGLPASVLLNRSEAWPRMLVSALLKSSATERANCNAQSSFCLWARLASAPPRAAPSAAGSAASAGGFGSPVVSVLAEAP